jgi:hypothetical protein
MFSLGIGALLVKIVIGIGVAVAAVLGIKGYGASRERQGEAKATTKIAENNARVQQEMAAVERPTEDEALKRLGDGTA